MDSHIFLWFWTIVAFMYGAVVGSFLNVCLYRLPPKMYFFDDMLYPITTGDLFTDIRDLFRHFFTDPLKDKNSGLELEPYLYAEVVWPLHLKPELAAVTAITHNFNLYKEYFPETVTIVKPRSFCPNCKNMIKWWMNIPLLSWVFLKARCYYCKEPISIRYPLNELISGLICAGLFYLYGTKSFPAFLYYYIISCVCIVTFYIDLEHWLILDEITLPFTLVGLILSMFVPAAFFVPNNDILGLIFYGQKMPDFIIWYQNLVKSTPSWFHLDSLVQSFLGGLLGYASFYSIAILGTVIAGREAMGGGDIKFAMLMGVFLGPQKAVLAFFLAVILGTVTMVPAMLIGKKTGKDQVPFGCFLTIATIITVMFGGKLISLYMNWPGLMYQ